MLMKIIAANNLHILLLLATNVLSFNNILQCHTLSVYINTDYPHPKTWHAVYQYCLVKCIIPICIFTTTTTDESCSCPYYRGYTTNSIPIPTVLLWLLFPFPWEYRRYCPHYCGLLPFPSPCHSLVCLFVCLFLSISVISVVCMNLCVFKMLVLQFERHREEHLLLEIL